jgi:hypothetical protein
VVSWIPATSAGMTRRRVEPMAVALAMGRALP